MKEGKAPGIDEIQAEIIKHFRNNTQEWILKFFNECRKTAKIPKQWLNAKVIALLKPEKLPNEPKNFRPISLLCHLYKLYNRLILNRITPVIEENLIENQAGFQPGKFCTSQILNLIQNVEDGFETKKITGAVFIDLTPENDTVKHNLFFDKVYKITKDYHLTKVIQSINQNRRFHLRLQGQKSRWRNSTPHGHTFSKIEQILTHALEKLDRYYTQNSLKPNPIKTQVSAFHLNNKQARKELKVQ